MPALTSIAGRHAADRARQRAAEAALQVQQEISLQYRKLTAHALRARGIRVLERHGEDEVDLVAHCSVDRCQRDNEVIDATVTELGFELDPTRLSRYRDRFEYVRLFAPATGARLAIVISRPGALSRPAEAA